MSARIFSAAALLATIAQAANVNVLNNCNFEVTYTPSQEGTDAGQHTLQPGKTYTAPAEGSAYCLKLYAPGATKPTQLEWSTWEPSPGNTLLSYDLSDIDMGDDVSFLKHGMNLTSEDPSCNTRFSTCRPAICKPQGAGSITPCEDAYNLPFDVRTLGASASYDINMVLCTANEMASSEPAAPASSESAPEPESTIATAPAPPATTAAPVQEGTAGNAYVDGGNVVTQWVQNTEVVTQIVTAREAEPTLEKRFRHPHGHHGRHNFA